MSSMSLKKGQNASCLRAYRLNRAALMRMEEGRRRVSGVEDEFLTERVICIELENARHSRTNTLDQTIARTEHLGYSVITSDYENVGIDKEEEANQNKARTKAQKIRKKGRNSSAVPNQPRVCRKERSKPELSQSKRAEPEGRKRVIKSAGVGKEPSEDTADEMYLGKFTQTPPRRKFKRKMKSQSSQVSATPSRTDALNLASPQVPADTHRLRRNAETRNPPGASHSPDVARPSPRRPSTQEVTPRSNRPANVTWGPLTVSSIPTSKDPRARSKGPIQRGSLRDTIPSLSENPAAKEEISLSKQEPHGSAGLQGKMARNAELYEDLKASAAHNLLVSSRKQDSALGSKPGKFTTRKLVFQPLSSTTNINPDQNEVISKWRKRLGTSSPFSATPNQSSSVIASSSLRDSQILRIQNESSSKGNKKGDSPPSSKSRKSSHLKTQRVSPEMSLDEIEIQNLVGKWINQQGNDNVLSSSEVEALFLELEMEKKRKQIRRLEEVTQEKLKLLELIRLKKKKALEDELMINDKLKRILKKIQEIRESASFDRLMNKETQVFTTKKGKPNK